MITPPNRLVGSIQKKVFANSGHALLPAERPVGAISSLGDLAARIKLDQDKFKEELRQIAEVAG